MAPVNWFSESHSSCKLDKPPNPAGISPVNPSSESRNSVTRNGEPPTVTPSQVVTGALADQFSVPVPASVSRAASSLAQSAARPGVRAEGYQRQHREPMPPSVVSTGVSSLFRIVFQVSGNLLGGIVGKPLPHHAAIPATWGAAWLVPGNQQLFPS